MLSEHNAAFFQKIFFEIQKYCIESIFTSTYLPQLVTIVNAKKYRFSYSKDNGRLSPHKLQREDKMHLAKKIVVDGCD